MGTRRSTRTIRVSPYYFKCTEYPEQEFQCTEVMLGDDFVGSVIYGDKHEERLQEVCKRYAASLKEE